MEKIIYLSSYCQYLANYANQPLDMQRVLSPFEMHCESVQSEYLLNGHLADWMLTQYDGEDKLTVFDILEQLSFLGFAPAEQLVESLHFLIEREMNIEELNAPASLD